MISNSIKYIGVNDHDIDLFEGQYKVPLGMSYNSYIIKDEKIAVIDTVDAGFGDEWLSKIRAELGCACVDYLIVHHMEPDHSANIMNFKKAYPNATIVSSAAAFKMMKGFFGTDFSDCRLVVTEGSKLSLGEHELTFIAAPMVHWPEVIMSYESIEKVFFSADAFGKFGALDFDDEWACEARRYYFGIVGKYGAQVQALLKKAECLDIKCICPLHGPILSENIDSYIGLYNTWSSYESEDEGIVIAYTSVYGNTKKAVMLLADKLAENGCERVSVIDLARCDMAEAVEDAFRYSKLVLATTTYNSDIFPFMREFINHLTERGFSKKTVGFIESGSWAPVAAKKMKELLAEAKELTFTNASVKIICAPNEETKLQISALADELCR